MLRPLASRPVLVLFVSTAIFLSACSSPRQIRVSSPQPVVPVRSDSTTAPQSSLTVVLVTGATGFPDEIRVLRFRIAEVWLFEREIGWTVYPAPSRPFELIKGERVRKPVLSTQIEAAPIDSVGISFRDVYVEFEENAGAPLSVPPDTPFKVATKLVPMSGVVSLLSIEIEPHASLLRLPNGRWAFLPFLNTYSEKAVQ